MGLGFVKGTLSEVELVAILKYTEGYKNVNTKNIEQWFEVHCNTPAYEVLC
jgi:hypothetical protein